MNSKFWIAVAVLFVAFSIMDFVGHGLVMTDAYQATQQLWRSMEEMNKFRPLGWVVTVVASFFFVLIFGKGYEGKGAMEGVRFGVYIGVFTGFPMGFGSYMAMPITLWIAFAWFFLKLIESIVAGILVASIYRPARGPVV